MIDRETWTDWSYVRPHGCRGISTPLLLFAIILNSSNQSRLVPFFIKYIYDDKWNWFNELFQDQLRKKISSETHLPRNTDQILYNQRNDYVQSLVNIIYDSFCTSR